MVHEGGHMIRNTDIVWIPCLCPIFFLIIPAVFIKTGLNNAGYIPNGHPG